MNACILSAGLMIGSLTMLLYGCAGKEFRSPIASGSPVAEKEPGKSPVAVASAPTKETTLSTEINPPETVIFSTRFGPVTFLHAKHQAFAPQQCATCHHQTAQGTTHACRSCHKGSTETKEGDPLSFSEVKMKFCRGCHARRKDEDQTSKAPVACEECHRVKE